MALTHTFKAQPWDTLLSPRNGQPVEIARTITEPSEAFSAEVLPMHEIVFADGFLTHCWPEELTEGVPSITE